MTINGVHDRRKIVDKRRVASDDYLYTQWGQRSYGRYRSIDSEELTLIKLEK